MSYIALYRKFRPQEFQDVKGQNHIVKTLKNQINADRIGHAYLFCGTRGTGKTTIAKIFAKAVNCEQPIEGSPCGTCPTCRSIQGGNSMNVIEIDAASNNGVDNIREIREEVSYSPTQGKYKVYIIDEVHMLSPGAFNALLKTLEEPPSYVIFILATTEAHKIPITILSRCQRYDFRRITIDTIAERLQELVEAEQIEVEEKALRYIAKAGDGSLRDAISLLDRCIAFYLGQKLTYDNVLDVLGVVDTEIFSKMLRQILNKDVSGVLTELEELIIRGREPGQFVTDFTWYLRNLLLLKSSANMEDVLDISSENLLLLKEEAEVIQMNELMRYIRIFSELSNQIRYAVQKRILVEMALVKLCNPQMEESVEALQERVDKLEKKIEQGIVVGQNAISTDVHPMIKENTTEDIGEHIQKQEIPVVISDCIQEVVKNWSSIIMDISAAIRPWLKKARLSLGQENTLLLIFEDDFSKDYINTDLHRQEIKRVIAEYVGQEINIQIIKNETQGPFEDSYVDLEKIIKMKITIEE